MDHQRQQGCFHKPWYDALCHFLSIHGGLARQRCSDSGLTSRPFLSFYFNLWKVPRREQPPKWADWLEEPKEALLPEIMSSSTPSAVDPIDTAQKPVRTRHVNKEEEALSKTAAPSAALPAWTRQADDVPVTRQR